MLRGMPASPGIAIGKAVVISEEELLIPDINIPESRVEKEVARFLKALGRAKGEVAAVTERVRREIGQEEARIFESHSTLLEDTLITDATVQMIRQERKDAGFALKTALDRVVTNFKAINDPYIKERVTDIQDTYGRILQYLVAVDPGRVRQSGKPVILVASNFAPSDVVQMHKTQVLGFVAARGSRNSHTAIVARALEIPAVVGAGRGMESIHTGDWIIVDGTAGEILVSPDERTLHRYQKKLQRYTDSGQELLRLRDVPAETLDGKRVELAANAELPIEVETILAHGACAIGLFRTEYLFLNRKTLPNEEEQFRAYRQICERVKPQHVTIRTLDVGADKPISALPFGREMNPVLGWRSIRVCLERPQLFETQLRAILRASAYGKVRLMFPMVTHPEELHAVQKILAKVKAELKEKQIKFDPGLEIGLMIETPGAVMIAGQLAVDVDFFSIGTNDLIQFTLAVDRTNERVAHLYTPHHPAVLRLIKHAVDAGHSNDIWVGVCGEMASDPMTAALLLGMGVDELSVNPSSVLTIKKFLRSVSYDEVRICCSKVMHMVTAREIEECLEQTFGARMRELQLAGAPSGDATEKRSMHGND